MSNTNTEILIQTNITNTIDTIDTIDTLWEGCELDNTSSDTSSDTPSDTSSDTLEDDVPYHLEYDEYLEIRNNRSFTENSMGERKYDAITISAENELSLIEEHYKRVTAHLKQFELPKNDEGNFIDIYGRSIIFEGLKGLKKTGVQLPLTQLHIDEIIKCSQDIIYFAEHYVQILTPLGYRPVLLRDFQFDFLLQLQSYNRNLAKLPRQAGKSVTTCIYYLHKLIFSPVPETIGFAANVLSLAQENLDRLKEMFVGLGNHPYIQIGVDTWNKTNITLEGKKRILTSAMSDRPFMGYTLTGLFVDEFAFINNMEEIETSLLPTLSQARNGGDVIYISTPKGKNVFYEKWMLAISGNSEFKHFGITWDTIPGRNEEFKERMLRSGMTVQKFRQEYQTTFIGSSHTLVDGDMLEYINNNYIKPTPQEFYQLDGVRQYEKPLPNHRYVLSLDGAKDGIDELSFHVIDITTFPFKQVLSANLLIEYLRMPFYINLIGTDYNLATIIVENNEGAGQSIVDSLNYNYEYPYLYKDMGKSYFGFRTTSKTRNGILSSLKMFIEKEYLIIQDDKTYQQLLRFVDSGSGKFEAEKGHKDDLVMALAIAFAPFQNMKNFNDYDKLINIMENNMKDSVEEKEQLQEILSLGFFNDDPLDGEYNDDPIINAKYDEFLDSFVIDDVFDYDGNDDNDDNVF